MKVQCLQKKKNEMEEEKKKRLKENEKKHKSSVSGHTNIPTRQSHRPLDGNISFT